jgi:ferritin-like metal-binding protein YciE
MSEKGTKAVVKLLVEAQSNELALITTLKAHSSMAEKGSYKRLVESHLRETQGHADLIARRLDQLGHHRSLPAAAYGTAQNALKQGLVMAKGPMDAIRGRTNVAEKMMRNAIDEAMTEGLEIGAYDALESLALSVGDHETAELAATIRADEVAMLEALRAEIPALANSFARTKVGAGETVLEPWDGYDDMTVDEIRGRLADASQGVVLSVRSYESKNKNRKTVIELTERETVAS